MAKIEPYKDLSDEDLVHRYRNSYDMAYIGELYQRYTHLVYGVCLKYLKDDAAAEDAVMQIFEKLITDLKKHHITTLKPWLHTVVKNHCMMQFRKEAVEVKRKTELKAELNDVVENLAEHHLNDAADKEFVLQHMKDGLHELKEEQRICIELFYLKNSSYAEISVITGYSIGDVKSYIQNGKRNLKNYITAKNEQAEKGHNENL